MEILSKILVDKKKRTLLIEEFQNNIWNGYKYSDNETANEILSELAYILDYYQPDQNLRKEDLSYYGDDRLKNEIESALKKLHNL